MARGQSIKSLLQRFGLSGQIGLWRLLAFLFALLNLKNLPFSWHIRLLKGLFTHLRSSRVRLASKAGPAALFQPMITSSRSGTYECDYNFHKSNSTYFSDFDVGRLELLVSLCTHGIEKTRQELAKEGPESFAVMLGAVSCNFRREIKPFQGFEIWTRMLTWDHKWFYVIGHFVKKGAVRPKSYTLQPWKNRAQEESNGPVWEKAGPHPAIFASGIAKYVCKKGRRTIPPERVLQASGLLPPKPADHETPPISMTPNPEGDSINAAAASLGAQLTPDNPGEVLAASLTASGFDNDEWTWERVEKERQRGMKFAELYNSMEMLHEEFTGDERPVLGRY
ncbi:hypothetical protein ACLMJK_002005 [Lecanora helva]